MQESGSETRMASIEPHLVEMICAMGQIRRSLTGSECLSLTNDLIVGTQIEKDVIRWKKNRKEYDPEGPVLGKKVLAVIQKKVGTQVSNSSWAEVCARSKQGFDIP